MSPNETQQMVIDLTMAQLSLPVEPTTQNEMVASLAADEPCAVAAG